MLLDHADRLGAEQAVVETFLHQRFVIAVPILDPVSGVLEVIDFTHCRAVKGIEPSLPRPVVGLGMALSIAVIDTNREQFTPDALS